MARKDVTIGPRQIGVFLVAVAAAATGAIVAGTPGTSGGDPATANVWIVPSGGTCSARSATRVTLAAAPNSAKCSGTQPFQAAHLLAACGDLVLVDTGDYATETMSSGHSGTCAEITIAAGPGETVTADDFALDGASNVRIAGQGWDNQNPDYGTFTIGETDPSVGSPDIRGGTNVGFDGIDVVSSGIMRGGDGIFFRNSDIGPYSPPSCPGSGFAIANEDADLNGPVGSVEFTGNLVHEFEVGGCAPPNDHLDCVHIYEHITGTLDVSRNVFYDCENYGILYGSNQTSTAENATFENNWFGAVDTTAGFALRGSAEENFSNVTVQFNSGLSAITPQTTSTLTNVIWRGNVAPNMGSACRSGITYTQNKLTTAATTCGTGDEASVTPGFVNGTSGATMDLHLQAGSALINDAGASGPSTDYDGDSRPQGAAFDAGSDERG